jgi:Protein of unknown function (DUF3892)
MPRRAVNKTGKDSDGDITKLCNSGQAWSPRTKRDAISDIENNICSYYVVWDDGKETEIRVVDDSTKGKYLRTDRDSTQRNNLDDLPDC